MKKSFALLLMLLSTVVYGQKIDPNAVAQQYLTDLCTLDENKFVNKYMLTQVDFLFFYNQSNKNGRVQLSDSLTIRAEVYKNVLQTYRDFQESITPYPSLKKDFQYKTCFYELEYKNRDTKILMFDELTIHFKSDTNYFALFMDDLVYINNRWLGGDYSRFYTTDSLFQRKNESNYDAVDAVAVDSAAVADYDYSYDDAVVVDTAPSKKQQKIQKKIDAYYRKIDLLYQKQ